MTKKKPKTKLYQRKFIMDFYDNLRIKSIDIIVDDATRSPIRDLVNELKEKLSDEIENEINLVLNHCLKTGIEPPDEDMISIEENDLAIRIEFSGRLSGRILVPMVKKLERDVHNLYK